jgi:predicted dehydrogenase
MTDLRVGIVGVQGIGLFHAFALANASGASLTAVCDIDDAAAGKAGADFGVPAFGTSAALYASGEVDAVVIATPAGTHGPLVREALDAGLHVYCEKPIAPTAEEGYALQRHAVGRDRILQVGFQFRFHKGYRALLDAAAGIGQLVRVNVTATNWFRAEKYFAVRPWRATWSMAGGGVLMNQAVHQVDMMIAIAGLPARVEARARRARHRAAVEDDAIAVLEWSSGAVGVLTASLCEPAGYERFEVFGARGAVVLNDGYDVRATAHDDAQRVTEECPDEFPELETAWHQIPVTRKRSEWLDMLVDAQSDFAASIREGRGPLVDGVEGTRSVELANAIYLSAVEARAVELPLQPEAYAPVFQRLSAGSASISGTGRGSDTLPAS